MKKIFLSLILILIGVSTLSGCTKDEILNHYNNVVQSAGSIELALLCRLRKQNDIS